MSSFTQKQLRASLILPQGNFPGTNSNTLVLTGLRMSAQLEQVGRWTNSCDLRIWGMRQEDMSAVTVLFGQGGEVPSINVRALLILESNDGSGWLQVFEGQFIEGGPDYSQPPDVCLHVMAMTGAGQQYLTAEPSSYRGAQNAAMLASSLASKMGFQFENNGVRATVNSPYLPGTLMDQFRALAEAAPFNYYFDAKATLIICPPNQPRQGKTPIPVNPQTGLVGYPKRTRFGLELTVLFSPAIQPGWPIQVSGSTVRGANGAWFPYAANHDLESITPSGRWFSQLKCSAAPIYASGPTTSLLTASAAL
jgi:hypothetical protein